MGSGRKRKKSGSSVPHDARGPPSVIIFVWSPPASWRCWPRERGAFIHVGGIYRSCIWWVYAVWWSVASRAGRLSPIGEPSSQRTLVGFRGGVCARPVPPRAYHGGLAVPGEEVQKIYLKKKKEREKIKRDRYSRKINREIRNGFNSGRVYLRSQWLHNQAAGSTCKEFRITKLWLLIETVHYIFSHFFPLKCRSFITPLFLYCPFWVNKMTMVQNLIFVFLWRSLFIQLHIFIFTYRLDKQNGSKSKNIYPPIIYYWTVPLILDHSYLVGKSTSSKIVDTNVSGF